MAESSEKAAPSSSADSELLPSPKHCQACGVAVKDHLGPHGRQRCVAGLIDSLKQRIDVLEQLGSRHDEELRREKDLHVERQSALLATIEALEERIVCLEKASDGRKSGAACCNCRCTQSTPSPVTHDHDEVHVLEGSQAKADNDTGRMDLRTVAATLSDGRFTNADALSAEASTADTAVARSLPVTFCEQADNIENTSNGGVNKVSDASGEQEPKAGSMEGAWANGPPLVAGGSDPGISSEEPWRKVRSGRRRRDRSHKSRLTGSPPEARHERPGLAGATRKKCSAFHLGGISPHSQAEDVRRYCHDRRVLVTGLYWIHTRVWGTQSAKVYVSEDAADRVLSDGFWPEHIRCRQWQSSPPSSPRSGGGVVSQQQ